LHSISVATEVLHGSHVAWQEQQILFPMGKNVLSNANHFHFSRHAIWLPLKTQFEINMGGMFY